MPSPSRGVLLFYSATLSAQSQCADHLFQPVAENTPLARLTEKRKTPEFYQQTTSSSRSSSLLVDGA